MIKKNIFNIAQKPEGENEIFETLCKTENLHIERIISTGQTTPENQWYDSDKSEWVLLIQGNASLEMENGSVIDLISGDYLLIPAHQKHRVLHTSKEPHCLWLALHFKEK